MDPAAMAEGSPAVPDIPFPAETPLLRFHSSPIHGLGAFAKQTVPDGARLIEYIGEKLDRAESLRRCQESNEYIFALNDKEDLDGNVEWNPARFINHSCAPNSEAVLENGRIWLLATRRIAAGEEITFNYGYDLEDYRDYPCHCASPDCVGFIVAEAFFDHVRRQRR
jgi:uncharacterized protein